MDLNQAREPWHAPTCASLQVRYKDLVDMSMGMSLYDGIIKDHSLVKARKKALLKIFKHCDEDVFNPYTCALAMLYYDILSTKVEQDDLLEESFIDVWTVVCFRLALKVVQKNDVGIEEFETRFSLDADWNDHELKLAKYLDWKLCQPTLMALFRYLKGSFGLRYDFKKMRRWVLMGELDDMDLHGSDYSNESTEEVKPSWDEAFNLEEQYKFVEAVYAQHKMDIYSYELILQVSRDEEFFHTYPTHVIAAALVLLLCDIYPNTTDFEDRNYPNTAASEDDIHPNAAASEDDIHPNAAASEDDIHPNAAASEEDIHPNAAASEEDIHPNAAASEDDIYRNTAAFEGVYLYTDKVTVNQLVWVLEKFVKLRPAKKRRII